MNYAGALSLEIRTFNDAANTGDYYIRFNFKNGTDDADFTPYPMLGRTDGDFDVPFAEFMERLAVRECTSHCLKHESSDQGSG